MLTDKQTAALRAATALQVAVYEYLDADINDSVVETALMACVEATRRAVRDMIREGAQ